MRLRKLSHQEKPFILNTYKQSRFGATITNCCFWVLKIRYCGYWERHLSVSSCPRTAETRPANTKTHSHNLHANLSSLALPQEARCSLHFCKFPTIFLAARFWLLLHSTAKGSHTSWHTVSCCLYLGSWHKDHLTWSDYRRVILNTVSWFLSPLQYSTASLQTGDILLNLALPKPKAQPLPCILHSQYWTQGIEL